MNGWWKFHRSMYNHPVWRLPHSQIIVWLTILGKANHTSKAWFDGTIRVHLQPGEFITSQSHLAEAANTTRQVVRDTLTALIRLGTIGTKIRTKRYTQISIVNWPIYQGEEMDENQDENRKRTKREPSENHSGRRKEEKLPFAEANGNGHDPRVRELVLYWYAGCQLARKFKPPETWAKDGAIVKTMLAGRGGSEGMEEVRYCLDSFLENPPRGFGPQDNSKYSGKCTLQSVLMCMDQLLQRRARGERVNGRS